MNKKRLYKIIKFAINRMEEELNNGGLWEEDDIHRIILTRFGITENDYQRIMFGKPDKKESGNVVEAD